MYSSKSFPGTGSLSHHLLSALINAANNSLANSTWSQYKTARRHLERCQLHTGIRMSFPMSDRQIFVFISYMLVYRKVQSTTVSKNLSAIRTLHLIEGVNLPILRDDRVKAILQGQANWDEESRRDMKPSWHPVTLNVLRLIKIQLKRSKFSQKRKALIWCACTTAFNGCKMLIPCSYHYCMLPILIYIRPKDRRDVGKESTSHRLKKYTAQTRHLVEL